MDKGAVFISLISGFVGTCIGGFITFFITRYSLNKQFQNNREFEEEKYKKKQEAAIRVVCNEFRHNVTNLIAIKNMIKADNLKETVILEDLSKLICNDYWNANKILLWDFEDKKAIEKIEYFYFNLLLETNCKITDISRVEEHVRSGVNDLKYLNKYL